MKDLFCCKDKNLEELFSESFKHFTDKKNESKNQKLIKISNNSISNIKNNTLIIQEISSFLKNKENKMYRLLTPDKTISNYIKSDKILIESFNSNTNNSHNFMGSIVDEKFENKDLFSSLNYTSTTAEVKINKFNEKNAENDQSNKDKIMHIFNEIKDNIQSLIPIEL